MNQNVTLTFLCMIISINCRGGDAEHGSRSMLSNLFHSTVNWCWDTSLQKAKDEKQLWEASNDPASYVVSEAINATSYVVSEAINKTQALNLPQKLGQFNALTQYYAQHYARSPYATGIVLTTAGAAIGSPELAALGLVGGCSQAITGSINDLGTKQQREFVKTITKGITDLDHRLTNQQDQLRVTIHALGDTVATLDDRITHLGKALTHQHLELSQTFNRGAETLVCAGKEASQIVDQTLTRQQQELRKTFDAGAKSIKEVTREALQETVSHAGRTAVQSFAYMSSIALGTNLVYRNLSREIITNKELSLAALGGVMIAAPIYFSTRTMSPNPIASRITTPVDLNARPAGSNPLASRVVS